MEFNKKKVSIILPFYNAEKYLKECLASIKAQSYNNCELIMVDDGSTDNSLFIAKQFCSTTPWANVIQQRNMGVSCARNTALKTAAGEYITFIDADDIVGEHYIDALVALVERKENSIGIISYTRKSELLSQEPLQKESVLEENIETVFDTILEDNKIGGYLWNKIFHKYTINRLKLKFEENILVWEDLYFVIQYLKNIHYCSVSRQNFYYYRDNECSTVRTMSIKKRKCLMEMAQKVEKIEGVPSEKFYCDALKLKHIYESQYLFVANKKKCLSKEMRKEILWKDLIFNKGIKDLSLKDKFKLILMLFGIL